MEEEPEELDCEVLAEDEPEEDDDEEELDDDSGSEPASSGRGAGTLGTALFFCTLRIGTDGSDGAPEGADGAAATSGSES